LLDVVFAWTLQGMELAAQASSAKLIAGVSIPSGKSTTISKSLSNLRLLDLLVKRIGKPSPFSDSYLVPAGEPALHRPLCTVYRGNVNAEAMPRMEVAGGEDFSPGCDSPFWRN